VSRGPGDLDADPKKRKNLAVFGSPARGAVRQPPGVTIERYSCGPRARFNIAHGQLAPIRRADRAIAELHWGLTPPWRGHGGRRGPLVYDAPIDAIAGTPLLRDAFRRGRCLVLADGVYTWSGRQPRWHHPEPRGEVGLAGVWAVRDDDRPSFALLHADSALVVTDETAWLDGSPETALAAVAPVTGWPSHPVSSWVDSVAHDDPRCVEPLAQGSLF